MCCVFGDGRILEHHALEDIPDEKRFWFSCGDYPLLGFVSAWAFPRSAFMLPIEFTAPRAIAPVFLRYARTAPRLEPLDSEYIAGSIAFLSFLAFWPRTALRVTAAGGLMLLANIG